MVFFSQSVKLRWIVSSSIPKLKFLSGLYLLYLAIPGSRIEVVSPYVIGL